METFYKICAGLLILQGTAAAIVKLTPTQADDHWLEKAKGFFDFIGGILSTRPPTK